jgi:hypothetical protein
METLAEHGAMLLMAPKITDCVKEMLIKTMASVMALVTVTEMHNK